ncbi:hypothetical protein [Mycobacterium gordonae]|uniref:hypothetical protein n=1 Tax=Mycobacterium gordonae TaxID=1778 RepID=UPI00114E1B5C|nr:hypothetical protein [Mycobacterium gordonae]MCV7010471.1 hypothetical protein [Mycobacterium gordonae]
MSAPPDQSGAATNFAALQAQLLGLSSDAVQATDALQRQAVAMFCREIAGGTDQRRLSNLLDLLQARLGREAIAAAIAHTLIKTETPARAEASDTLSVPRKTLATNRGDQSR